MTDYYVHGVAKLTQPIKKFACVAAVGSFVSEGVASELLEDARLGRIVDQLSGIVVEEQKCVGSLGSFTWRRIASVTEDENYGAADLQHDVLQSTHTQRAYMDKRFFEEARGYPWKLARGDVQANLKELRGAP